MLNAKVFDSVSLHKKYILIVTKYWDTQTTEQILTKVQENYPGVFFGIGENRVESLIEKKIPRQHMHFIGNIQSRKIPQIVQYCSVIHSLSSLKHANKIESLWISIKAFIQINLDPEKDIGISESELWGLLQSCNTYKSLEIIGISGMGNGYFSEEEKRKEFQKLIKLRNTHIPHWFISAGTSRDYEIALELWINIVRVGKKSIIIDN